MVGEVDKDEDGVLVIQRIQVTYHLRTDPENHETAERVHSFHAQKCPVYKTICGCVDITTKLTFEPD